MNSGWIYRDRIDRADVGKTVLDYYTQRYRHSSEQEWRDRLLAGQIWLDGQPVTAQTHLRRGQELAYHRPPWQEPDVPLTVEVLYEDADLLVVAKPSGLPVMPAGGFLEHTLLWQLRRRYPHDTPVPIHRLGRGTSGLVLLARSPEARSNLTRQMRDRRMGKVYWALAQGSGAADAFQINQPIGKIAHPVLGYIYGATEDGAFARSDCLVLRRDRTQMLMEVTILTGRPHQIRIHLAAAGFPLVGEPLYEVGGQPRKLGEDQAIGQAIVVPGDCGYFLHAHSLTFQHPVTNAKMQITSPAPAVFGDRDPV